MEYLGLTSIYNHYHHILFDLANTDRIGPMSI